MQVNLIKDHPGLIELTEEYLIHYSPKSYERLMKDWVMAKVEEKEVKLSKSESLIIECLYRLDFLTTEQLRTLFFPKYSYTGGLRCLNKLAKKGLIYKEYYPESRDEQWVLWKLSEYGLKYILGIMERDGTDRFQDRKGIKPKQLRHDTGVNQTFVDIAIARGYTRNYSKN